MSRGEHAPPAAACHVADLAADLDTLALQVHLPPGTATRRVDTAEIVGPDAVVRRANAAVIDPTERPLSVLPAVLDGWRQQGAALALLKRPPASSAVEFARLVEGARLPVLVLAPDASWFTVAVIVRERLAAAAFGMSAAGYGSADHDLDRIAESVSALVRAPVIIQDPGFQVLAHSQHQDGADEARAATVLERSLPDRFRKLLDEQGAIERVYRNHAPQLIEFDGHLSPRLAVAVRSGSEVLGSMWAVVDSTVDGEQIDAFADAAGVAALALIQQRSHTRALGTLREGLLAALLTDGELAVDAAERLGLAGKPVVVVALDTPAPTRDDADADRQSQRTVRALDLHLRSYAANAGVTSVGGQVFGVVRSDDGEGVAHSLRRFVQNIRLPDLVIGVGRAHSGSRGPFRSRTEAELVATASRAHGRSGVATLEESFADIAVLAVREHLDRHGIHLPFADLARLSQYDADHGTDLMTTLRVFTRTLGDISSTANEVRAHPNTVRYRLRRIRQIADLDLLDPNRMFQVGLQLRVLSLARGRRI